MDDLLTWDDLLAGAADLRLRPDGRPRSALTLVDLDRVPPDVPMLSPDVPRGVIVGVTGSTVSRLPSAVSAGLTTVATPDELPAICANVGSAPSAALNLARVLHLTARLPVAEGLLVESMAYSMLLAGPEFARWRASRPVTAVPDVDEPVLVSRSGDSLRVTLNRPERRNAFGRGVRDALLAALSVAEHDRSISEIVLDGRGPAFCSGGDLDEFGTADDLVRAHDVRLAASAGLAVHRLRDRVRPRLHGACVGAGIEVPAFASHVVADRAAWFQLPELSMGLVPGAGGTVSISRRVGRWRTALLALSGMRLDAATGLEWGLVDELSG